MDLSGFLGLPFLLIGIVLKARLTGYASSPSDRDRWVELLRFFKFTGFTEKSAPSDAPRSGGVSEYNVPFGDCE